MLGVKKRGLYCAAVCMLTERSWWYQDIIIFHYIIFDIIITYVVFVRVYSVEPVLSLSDWIDGIQKTVKHSIQQCRDPESQGHIPLMSLLFYSC